MHAIREAYARFEHLDGLLSRRSEAGDALFALVARDLWAAIKAGVQQQFDNDQAEAAIALGAAEAAPAPRLPIIDPAVQALVQPGRRVRMLFGYMTDSPRSELWHIRAIVDDDRVVYRVWRGNRWQYHVEDLLRFQLAWQDGGLTAA